MPLASLQSATIGAGSSGNSRTLLTSDVTLTISPGGNDGSGNLTSPFATHGGAYNWAQANLDPGGHIITAKLTGTLINPVGALEGNIPGAIGPGSFILDLGGFAIASNVSGFFCICGTNGAEFTVQNGTIEPTAQGIGIVASSDASIVFRSVNFNANGGHAFADGAGNRSQITVGGPWSITASGGSFLGGSLSGTVDYAFVMEDKSQLWLPGALTLAGVPHFNGAFVQADLMSQVDATGFTYSGSATGPRGNSNSMSDLFTSAGAPAAFFPGSTGVVVDATSLYN